MINAPTNGPDPSSIPAFPHDLRVLFGHQSVGMDILRGVQKISASTSILELDGSETPQPGYGIFHFKIGENGNPTSKIDHFARQIVSHSDDYDIAMMKLCYVDIHRRTDIENLFEHYRKSVEYICAAAPNVHLVHVTVPIRSVQLGIRSRIRLAVGGKIPTLEDNLQRNNYNLLLRSAFPHKVQLFDLASIEARKPDGSPCTRRYANKVIPNLCPGFTRDGGHLNDTGSTVVGREFVNMVGELYSRMQ